MKVKLMGRILKVKIFIIYFFVNTRWTVRVVICQYHKHLRFMTAHNVHNINPLIRIIVYRIILYFTWAKKDMEILNNRETFRDDTRVKKCRTYFN